MTDQFRLPKDFESLVYLTQLLQAEAVRTGVEYWRRNRKRTSGTLFWQLNDCWPVASWKSLDYYGRWKALHYVARRFYTPLLLSVEDDETKMGIHVTSDLTEPWEGTVYWSLETISGEILESVEETVFAKPLADTLVCSVDFCESVSDANVRDVVFICELRQGDEHVSLTVTPFVASKHLSLTVPDLKVDISKDGDKLVVDVSAKSLARFLELSLDGMDIVFTDNYFDLPAGRSVTVTSPLPDGWSTKKARTALKLRSLFDSF